MASFEHGVDLPVLGPLLGGRVPRGASIAFFYDPESEWSQLAADIVVGIAGSGLDTLMVVTSRPVDRLREELARRGADVAGLEASERLTLSDGFSAKAGLESKEKVAFRSLDPAEVAIAARDAQKAWEPWGAPYLFENMSDVVAAADERTFLKFYRTWTAHLCRGGFVCLEGFARDVHSPAFYASVATSVTGVVELRVEDIGGRLQNVARVRAFKGRAIDSRRHLLTLDDKLGAQVRPLEQA